MTVSESAGQTAGARKLVTVGHAAYLTDSARELVDRAIKRGKIPFKREGGLPNEHNDAKVRNIAKIPSPREWEPIREELRGVFDPDWRHERWDRQIAATNEKRLKASKAGSASAAARWGHPETPPESYGDDSSIPF